MKYEQLVEQLNPEMITNFKRAIEIGKWPDGSKVSDGQRANCLAAVIAYEEKHVAETDRVGYIDRGPKADGELCDDEPSTLEEQPIKWS